MNREIKFRAWSNRKNEMRKVVQLDWLDSGAFRANLVESSEFWNAHLIGTFDGKYVEDFVLMQFTGLRDKNWKEIYEGDILGFQISENLSDVVKEFKNRYYVGITTTVVYDETKARFCCDKSVRGSHKDIPDILRYSFIVIGNVYENPELLKKS